MADNFHPVPVFEETYTPGGLLSAVRLPLGTILRLRFQDVEAAPGLHLGTGESGFRVYPGREHAEAYVALAVSTSIAFARPRLERGLLSQLSRSRQAAIVLHDGHAADLVDVLERASQLPAPWRSDFLGMYTAGRDDALDARRVDLAMHTPGLRSLDVAQRGCQAGGGELAVVAACFDVFLQRRIRDGEAGILAIPSHIFPGPGIAYIPGDKPLPPPLPGGARGRRGRRGRGGRRDAAAGTRVERQPARNS